MALQNFLLKILCTNLEIQNLIDNFPHHYRLNYIIFYHYNFFVLEFFRVIIRIPHLKIIFPLLEYPKLNQNHHLDYVINFFFILINLILLPIIHHDNPKFHLYNLQISMLIVL